MRHLCASAATLAMSSHGVAFDINSIECEKADSAQYKKDQDALYAKIGTRPITVQEVMADRRLLVVDQVITLRARRFSARSCGQGAASRPAISRAPESPQR